MNGVSLLSDCTYQGEFAGNALESRFDGDICFHRLLDSAVRNVEISRLFLLVKAHAQWYFREYRGYLPF